MRDLNECKAEVFRRSKQRIAERAKIRNRVFALCLPLCLVIAISAALLPSLLTLPDANFLDTVLSNAEDDDRSGGSNGSKTDGQLDDDQLDDVDDDQLSGDKTDGEDLPTVSDFGSLDSFSFSLTWGCYGISSYDSVTGKLIKTTDTTHPEDFVTTYRLTDAQKKEIYDLIRQLDVTKYPDSYNPQVDGIYSDPSMTLILTVSTDRIKKTITAKEIALLYQSEDAAGQKFLDVCKAIQDILTATDEWKALPEYEFYYD